MSANGLLAGAAATVVTPPVGVDLTGYGGRPSGCTAIHDNIYARALVLDNGARTVALLSLDVVGVDFDVLADIRKGVASATGIPANALLVNASHTHAGPATQTLRGLGEPDPEYVADFTRKAVETVAKAHENRVPARLGYGREHVQIGWNRRHRRTDGRIVIADNPHGVVVPHVDCLKVETAEGEPLAVWFSHACHPVTMGGDNLAVSSEFPGVAVDVVERVEGGTALFAQGCCGDINPIRRGSFDAVRKNGRILAAAVVTACETIEANKTDVPLDAALETVPLSLQPPTPLDQVERQIESFERLVAEAKEQGLHRGHVWLRQAWLDWAISMRVFSLDPKNAPKTCPFEVQAIRVDDMAILGTPAETFAEVGNAISDNASFALTTVLGYTNGCHGYFPTGTAHALGGYEVVDAIRYYGTLMFAPASDGELRSAAVGMLEALRRG
jgi:hypothetical protein